MAPARKGPPAAEAAAGAAVARPAIKALRPVVTPNTTPCTFGELGLDPWLVDALASVSIRHASDIQKAVIPPILAGRDVIGGAKTGSGKTAAFALPILQQLFKDPYGIYAVVLTPTRELGFQIAEQFRVLGTPLGLRLMVATGGRDITAQAIELSRRPHIIVATPGRLADLMTTSNDTSLFSRLKFLVMDEADRMMDPSFAESLRVVLRVLPSASRQTLLFSATITPQLEAIQSSKALPPLIIKVSQRFEAVERLKQSFIFTPSHLRDHALFHLFTDAEEAVAKDKSVIIFASRPQTVERLRLMLRRLKIDSSGLHSLLTQNQRLATLERFKSHKLNLLIATDVGGRGLDIPDVDLVINYDLPADPADYMHRVGRTARMGKDGEAISFVTERDVTIHLKIEEVMGKKMDKMELNEARMMDQLEVVAEARRRAQMYMEDTKFGEKRTINAIKHARMQDAQSEAVQQATADALAAADHARKRHKQEKAISKSGTKTKTKTKKSSRTKA